MSAACWATVEFSRTDRADSNKGAPAHTVGVGTNKSERSVRSILKTVKTTATMQLLGATVGGMLRYDTVLCETCAAAWLPGHHRLGVSHPHLLSDYSSGKICWHGLHTYIYSRSPSNPASRGSKRWFCCGHETGGYR